MAEYQPSEEPAPREPTVQDLRDLCHELNQRGAKYAVIEGFAIRAANYIRAAMDIDLLVNRNAGRIAILRQECS